MGEKNNKTTIWGSISAALKVAMAVTPPKYLGYLLAADAAATALLGLTAKDAKSSPQ